MATYCTTDWEVLFSKNYETFTVNYGDTVTIRCEGGLGHKANDFEYKVSDPDLVHEIKLWKKDRRTRRYNRVVADISLPIGSRRTIKTEQLGVGKFMYRNNNGEKIRFYVR
ncbi:MAG: hypothetical protein AN487_19165 [Anabaena sp. CRKS33]|nr:MAG: hypothetical protein AN487_19165 [Anabaena sp. CRKS33]